MNLKEYEEILTSANNSLKSNQKFEMTPTGFRFIVDGETASAIVDFHSSTREELLRDISEILNDYK